MLKFFVIVVQFLSWAVSQFGNIADGVGIYVSANEFHKYDIILQK